MRTEGSRSNRSAIVLKGGWLQDAEVRAPISSDNLGGYMIVDMSGNAVAAGGRFELTLEEVGSGCETCADRGCGWGRSSLSCLP